MRRRTLLTLLALAGVSACAWGYDEHYYGPGPAGDAPPPVYRGRAWAAPQPPRAPYEGRLTGPGLAQLDDWLKDTPEGRAIVTLGFSDAANGVISEETADRANIWFRRYADTNHDMTITDAEIRTALVAASRRYLHPRR
ncbi:MAG: hypothetical protein JO276_02055 [Sphingomonadaceae bacterium]|nr:hypothetical protein [Sphingomonadaceae bacterium]